MAKTNVEKFFAESNDQQVRLQIAAQMTVQRLDRLEGKIGFMREAISKLLEDPTEAAGAADFMLDILREVEETRRYSRAALFNSERVDEDENRDETDSRIREMEQALLA